MQMRQTHRATSRTIPPGVALNLLASALTILTAVALLVTAAVLGDAPATVAVPERHDRVVRDFYGAVNELLRSGDPAALDRVVAPDLVFHPPSARIAPDRAGLERYLAGIHDTVPAFRLRVEDVVSDGDRAVARVVGGSEKPGGFLGLTLATAPSTWEQFDSFRIADRRIVEIRSGAPASVLFEPATEVRLDLATDPQAVSVERLSASTGERREWGPFFGARVLYVDEGALAVDLDPTGPPPVLYAKRNGQVQATQPTPGARVVVTAGDAMAFPPGSRYVFRHDATDSGAAAFTVALPRFPYLGPHQPQAPTAIDEGIAERADPGVVQTTWGGEPVLDPLAGVTVALGRAHLPSGASIAFQDTDGYVFVVVETGVLVLTTEREVLSLNRLETDGLWPVKPGEPFALHNLGDAAATVFMVTLLPRSTPAAPAS